MSAVLTSEVTQLLYRATPQLNFAQVVSEVCNAFTPASGAPPILTWDCDDIALIDFSAARVVLGFSENLPGLHTASVTVAVGQSPFNQTVAFAKSEQIMLCKAVTNRLERRFPCDAQQSQTFDQPLTPDLIDRVVDALFQPDEAASQQSEPISALPEMPDNITSVTTAEPNEMERLMHRLSSELTARTPSLISRAIASATPKGRNAATKDQGKLLQGMQATFDTASTTKPTAKTVGGLFWRKGPPAHRAQVPADADHIQHNHRRASSSELKAVRDALYAPEVTRDNGRDIIAARTKQAWRSFAALPHSLAATLSDKSRRDPTALGNRAKP